MKTGIDHQRLARLAGIITAAPLLATFGLVGIEAPNAGAAPAGYTFKPIAFLGDPAPGDGVFVNDFEPDAINDRGEVTFFALVDTGEAGLYVYTGGSIQTVAKTGTVLPGVGTILNLSWLCGRQLNNHGQILFACTLTDGRIALLLATPNDSN